MRLTTVLELWSFSIPFQAIRSLSSVPGIPCSLLHTVTFILGQCGERSSLGSPCLCFTFITEINFTDRFLQCSMRIAPISWGIYPSGPLVLGIKGMGVKCFEFGGNVVVNVLDILIQIHAHFENIHETFCLLRSIWVCLYREGNIWMFPICDRLLDAPTFLCSWGLFMYWKLKQACKRLGFNAQSA